jgi:uncharacterized protein
LKEFTISPGTGQPAPLRLRADLLRQRLHRQNLKGKEAPEPTWFSRLSRRVAIEAFLRAGLKVSLLQRRGYRNFLNFQVVHNQVTLPRLPKAFDGLRILQLSDLHIDLDPGLVPALLSAVANLEYDLCVITGDFRNLCFGPHEATARLTRELHAVIGVPVLAVLGNHDPVELAVDLEAGGLRFLLNENLVLERDGEFLYVLGVDDTYYYCTDDLEQAMQGVDPAGCKLLLSHAPVRVAEAAEAGIDWQVGGHTHGGQICLPGAIPVIVHGNIPRQCLVGAWQWGAMKGYTSRGTGACGVPVRFNCPPEITLHTLLSPESYDQ